MAEMASDGHFDRFLGLPCMASRGWSVCEWIQRSWSPRRRQSRKPCQTGVVPGVCHWWGHDCYPNVCPGWHQPNFGKQAWLRIKGAEGRSHAATQRLPGRRGAVNGEVGLHQPPLPIGKTPSAKTGRWGTQGGTHTHLRGLRHGPHDQGAKNATHSGQIGSQ